MLEIFKKDALYKKVELLILIQILQTFFEFYSYIFPPELWISNYGLRLYYLTSLATLILIPRIIYELVHSKIYEHIDKIIIALLSIFFTLTFFSDLIIADVGHTGITLTRIAGPLYWLFQTGGIASILLTFSILLTPRKASSELADLKYKNLAISFSLFSGYMVAIIIIMIFFDNVNAAGVLPIFMSIFLLYLAKSLRKDKVFDWTHWLPFSKRRRMIKRLVRPLITVCEDGIGIDAQKEYDSIVSQHALELFRGDKTKANYWLQSYRPPLYSD